MDAEPGAGVGPPLTPGRCSWTTVAPCGSSGPVAVASITSAATKMGAPVRTAIGRPRVHRRQLDSVADDVHLRVKAVGLESRDDDTLHSATQSADGVHHQIRRQRCRPLVRGSLQMVTTDSLSLVAQRHAPACIARLSRPCACGRSASDPCRAASVTSRASPHAPADRAKTPRLSHRSGSAPPFARSDLLGRIGVLGVGPRQWRLSARQPCDVNDRSARDLMHRTGERLLG